MSFLQYPDAFNIPELQIWNNAAFDNGESEDSTAVKASWSTLQSVLLNQSLESDCSKENKSPLLIDSPVLLKSALPTKPLHSNNYILNSKGKPLKGSCEAFATKPKIGKGKEADEEKRRDGRNIDIEIEEIEKEIGRLSSRLEALRLEKAEHTARSIAMRGRVVPAKFMEQRQAAKNPDSVKKIEDSLLSSAQRKINRRGVSLGPTEIFSAMKSRQASKQEMITPVQSIQSRRKSCFWKLQDIDEEKLTKERGKSLSLSPKSRTTTSKIQAHKQVGTTVGSKRPVKKEDRFLAAIQPKKLFKDGEKSETAKKPLKAGRVVASRYTQISGQTNGSVSAYDARKRSFQENDKEESSSGDNKRRASHENSQTSRRNQKSESRVKKRWEIPTEVVVYEGEEEEVEPPLSVTKAHDELPKIRTLRFAVDSPRDSGPAKRVAELVGRKTYFCNDEEAGKPVCQALSFAVEDVDEEQ